MAEIYNMDEYHNVKGYQVRKGPRRNPKRKRKSGCGGCLISFLFMICVCTGIFVLLDRVGVLPQVADLNIKKVPFQQVQIDEGDLSGKYYYGQLNEEEQVVYKELVQGIENQDMKIYVHMADGDHVMEIFQYVLNDYPEFFWCSGDVQGVYYDDTALQKGSTEVKPVYTYSISERKEKQQIIEEAAQSIIAGVDAEATEYQRVKYVFEYIVKNTDYNLEAADNQNVLSVFMNHESVCAGYARANQYLLERMGIFCTYVVGTAKAGGAEQPHAWNIVKIDQQYYNVDVTWGDPVFQSSEEGNTDIENYIYHDYLCVTDEFMSATHTPEEGVPLPTCNSNACNYYVMNGSYYEGYSGAEALGVMEQSIENKEGYTDFQYGSREEYEKAKVGFEASVMKEGAQYLARRYSLSQVSYHYQVNEDTNRITVFWQYE